MEKKILNEQMSRIKNMMGKILNEQFDDFNTNIQPEELPKPPQHKNTDTGISDTENTILELKIFASRLNHIKEDFFETFSKTEYWEYLRSIWYAIHTISNTEGSTRSDEQEYNIYKRIELIEDTYNQEQNEDGDVPDFENS